MTLGLAVAFGLGLLGWTLLEYVIHRFVFHGWRSPRALARDHLKHHGRTDWFAPARKKLAVATPVTFAIGGAAAVLSSLPSGVAFAAGLGTGWLVYEVIHRGIHAWAPLNRYGRWARRHHLYHHFGNPRANHGVTSPLWDWLFGTLERAAVVRVPARQAARLRWLFDAREHRDGAPAFLRDYRIVGGPKEQHP